MLERLLQVALGALRGRHPRPFVASAWDILCAVHVPNAALARIDGAIDQAVEQGTTLCAVEGLSHPVVIAKVFDRLTASSGTARSRVFGVLVPADDTEISVLSDDALLVMLNDLKARGNEPKVPSADRQAVETSFTQGIDTLTNALSELKLPFSVPDVQPLGILWPA